VWYLIVLFIFLIFLCIFSRCNCVCLCLYSTVLSLLPLWRNKTWWWWWFGAPVGVTLLASAVRARSHALRPPSIYAAANGWRASSGNSELAGGRRNGPSDAGARIERRTTGVGTYLRGTARSSRPIYKTGTAQIGLNRHTFWQ